MFASVFDDWKRDVRFEMFTEMYLIDLLRNEVELDSFH
jgi:hypothetical protein